MTSRIALVKSLVSNLSRYRLVRGSSFSALAFFLLLAVTPATEAGEIEEPTALAMAGDLLIARPAGLVVTALGSVVFVASLPFSAAGGNIDQAAEHLVFRPAKTTFVRCLGCTTAGYRSEAREEK